MNNQGLKLKRGRSPAGCFIAPLTFQLYWHSFNIGNPHSEYKAPFANIYRGMAVIGTQVNSTYPVRNASMEESLSVHALCGPFLCPGDDAYTFLHGHKCGHSGCLYCHQSPQCKEHQGLYTAACPAQSVASREAHAVPTWGCRALQQSPSTLRKSASR